MNIDEYFEWLKSKIAFRQNVQTNINIYTNSNDDLSKEKEGLISGKKRSHKWKVIQWNFRHLRLSELVWTFWTFRHYNLNCLNCLN